MEHKNNLPKGQYVMPVFDTREAAEDYADGRFGVMEFSATTKEAEGQQTPTP